MSQLLQMMRLFILLFLAFILFGCGKTGDLYLPEQKAPDPEAVDPKAADTEAAEQ